MSEMSPFVNDLTADQFRSIEQSRPKEPFNGFVIVPTDELHDSGYMMIKLVLTHNAKIVGCIGGFSDVVHLNGIGGYGLNHEQALHLRMTPIQDWRIDVLPCGLVRVFQSRQLRLSSFILSDLEIYVNYGDDK